MEYTDRLEVSIHTPARGVTGEIMTIWSIPSIVSIHTPARGVTYARSVKAAMDYGFNPHSRKGSDNINPASHY